MPDILTIHRLFSNPYFSVIIQFDRAAILVSWYERNWRENKMPLGRGGGVNNVGWGGIKNRASLSLTFTELVALASATPDWLRENRVHQSAAERWQLEWQEVAFISSWLRPKSCKMASISEEFSRDCFDYDRMSASSLGGLVFKRGQKETVSRSREDLPSCGSTNWNVEINATKMACIWTCGFAAFLQPEKSFFLPH